MLSVLLVQCVGQAHQFRRIMYNADQITPWPWLGLVLVKLDVEVIRVFRKGV